MDVAGGQAGLLHSGHGIGHDVEPVAFGQGPADLQSVGQQNGVGFQGVQVDAVAQNRVSLQTGTL